MLKRLALIFLAIATLTACGEKSPKTQWRLALEEVQGSVQDIYAQRFKQLVEKRTNGAVSVIIYPYGALGTSAQITEQVQNGALQFAFASPGHLGSVIPETQIFSLHFLLPDEDAMLRRVLAESPALYDLMGSAYKEKSLHLLAVIHEGWMVWTGNKPLRNTDDFAGFKMRTMVSPLLVEAYKAYGAAPTPMPYSEVYGALQLHMIDGQVNPVFAIEEMSFYEVQKVMTEAKHLPFVSTLVANSRFVEGLSEEHKAMLREVKSELDGYIFEQQQRLNAERLEKIFAAGDMQRIELTDEERNAFRQRSLPVRELYVEQAGARGEKIMAELLREINDAREAQRQ